MYVDENGINYSDYSNYKGMDIGKQRISLTALFSVTQKEKLTGRNISHIWMIL